MLSTEPFRTVILVVLLRVAIIRHMMHSRNIMLVGLISVDVKNLSVQTKYFGLFMNILTTT